MHLAICSDFLINKKCTKHKNSQDKRHHTYISMRIALQCPPPPPTPKTKVTCNISKINPDSNDLIHLESFTITTLPTKIKIGHSIHSLLSCVSKSNGFLFVFEDLNSTFSYLRPYRTEQDSPQGFLPLMKVDWLGNNLLDWYPHNISKREVKHI